MPIYFLVKGQWRQASEGDREHTYKKVYSVDLAHAVMADFSVCKRSKKLVVKWSWSLKSEDRELMV